MLKKPVRNRKNTIQPTSVQKSTTIACDALVNAPPVKAKASVSIVKFLKLLHPDGVFEIRVPNTYRDSPNQKGTAAGFFDCPEEAFRWIKEYDRNEPRGIHVTLNPVETKIMDRAKNFMVFRPRRLTRGPDIVKRRWIVIDIDPERADKTSATNDEQQLAVAKAKEIRTWLTLQGWPKPILVSSGNGAYLLYRVEVSNTAKTKDLIRRLLVAIATRFDDSAVKIDRVVFSAVQMIKVAGTWARKGENSPDRPHRRSYFYPPLNPLDVVSRELLEHLADDAPASSGSRPEGTDSEDSIDPKPAAQIDLDDLPDAAPDTVRRCQSYIDQMPEAIEGEKGSVKTFAVACVIARFGLSWQQAIEVMQTYNERCEPEWTGRELEKKLRDGYARVQDDGEFGVMGPTASRQKFDRERPVVELIDGELDQNINSICTILGRSGQIFVGPSLELVEPDEAGRLRVIDRDALPTRVTKYVDLRKVARNGTESPVNCPEDLAKRIFSDKNWVGIPRIVAVSKYPTPTSTGRIIQTAGLDKASGIYVASRPNDWRDVPEVLSKGDVAFAKLCLKSIFREYSFTRGDEGLAGAIALVLTAVARPAIDGPVPMFIAEATTPGAGKSMLIDLASIIATGEPAAMTTRVNSVETQKVIVSTIRAGGTWVVLDNEKQGCVFACPNIASVLTSHSIVGRVLGKSENFTAKNRLLMCATGNQLTFSNEICRRTLLIEIGKQTGKEWEIPDLRKHVREIQPALLRATLILLMHGLESKPLEQQPLESFEAWSDIVRRTVIRCYKHDPCALVDAARSRDADEDSNQALAAALIVLIREAIKKAPFALDGEPVYVNATKIAEQAIFALNSESKIPGVGSFPCLQLAAEIVASRCLHKSGRGIGLERVGKLVCSVIEAAVDVDGKMIEKGGRYGYYRVIDAT